MCSCILTFLLELQLRPLFSNMHNCNFEHGLGISFKTTTEKRHLCLSVCWFNQAERYPIHWTSAINRIICDSYVLSNCLITLCGSARVNVCFWCNSNFSLNLFFFANRLIRHSVLKLYYAGWHIECNTSLKWLIINSVSQLVRQVVLS